MFICEQKKSSSTSSFSSSFYSSPSSSGIVKELEEEEAGLDATQFVLLVEYLTLEQVLRQHFDSASSSFQAADGQHLGEYDAYIKRAVKRMDR